jgi:hypothetical protein
MAQPAADATAFKRVPADTLFVSEPAAEWFGNPPNESNSAAWTNKNWCVLRLGLRRARCLQQQQQLTHTRLVATCAG